MGGSGGESLPPWAGFRADVAWPWEEGHSASHSLGSQGLVTGEAALLSRVQQVDVVGPRGVGPHRVFSQAEHGMEGVFEALEGEAGRGFRHRLEA